MIREYKAKTRAARKRNTLINKTAGFFKGKNSNNSINNKLGSRFSIIKKNEDNGKFRNKDFKDLEIKNKKTMNKTKSEKNI